MVPKTAPRETPTAVVWFVGQYNGTPTAVVWFVGQYNGDDDAEDGFGVPETPPAVEGKLGVRVAEVGELLDNSVVV